MDSGFLSLPKNALRSLKISYIQYIIIENYFNMNIELKGTGILEILKT
jgi:hypothetical protein